MDGYSAQGLQTLLEFRVLPPVWQRWWFLVMASLILGLVVWMYFKWRESNLRRHQAMQQALADARYEALRSQVNPHFLFNSFNTLMALIETDTKRAGGYLNGLSRFFRSILQQREKSLERVGEELSLVFAYVELQKTRFEDALQLKMDVDDHWMNWGLPPLALQQLVENAIKHNFFSALQPLIIEVTVRESRLRVVNTYRPIPDSRHGGTSFGLQGLQRQLEALMKEPLVVGHNEVYFWVEIPLLPPTHAHFNH